MVVISDDHYEYEVSYGNTWSARSKLDKMNIGNTVVVGIGENHYLTGLKTMADNQENVLLCFDETCEQPIKELTVKGT